MSTPPTPSHSYSRKGLKLGVIMSRSLPCSSKRAARKQSSVSLRDCSLDSRLKTTSAGPAPPDLLFVPPPLLILPPPLHAMICSWSGPLGGRGWTTLDVRVILCTRCLLCFSFPRAGKRARARSRVNNAIQINQSHITPHRADWKKQAPRAPSFTSSTSTKTRTKAKQTSTGTEMSGKVETNK